MEKPVDHENLTFRKIRKKYFEPDLDLTAPDEAEPVLPKKAQHKMNKDQATAVVEETLMDLLRSAASDQARVAAAKALMELVKNMNDKHDSNPALDAQRAAAIAEARRLLDSFANLKRGGVAPARAGGVECADAMASDSKTEPDLAG